MQDLLFGKFDQFIDPRVDSPGKAKVHRHQQEQCPQQPGEKSKHFF
jgi:hypothetical protein